MHEKLESLKKVNIKKLFSVDVEGITVDVPAMYEDLSAFMFYFPVSYKDVKKLINSDRVTPVKIFSNTCLLGITIFDYKKSPVGPYREVALSIPSRIDTKWSLPILPLLFDSIFKNYGFYAILLATNTDLGKIHSNKVYGYPVHNKNIEVNINYSSPEMSMEIADREEHLFSSKINILKDHKLMINKKYNTYFHNNGKLYKVEMTAHTLFSESFSRDCVCRFGNHEIYNKYIKNLSIKDKPVKILHYKEAIEILSEPKEI